MTALRPSSDSKDSFMNDHSSTDRPIDTTMWSGLLHGGLGGTFMRVPYVRPIAEEIRASGAKAAIYGLPFDATTISRSGANYGPRAMREVSVQFTHYQATFDFDLFAHLPLVDTGDCQIALANPAVTLKRAADDIRQIVAGGAIPVTLGGDHSITIAAAEGAKIPGTSPGLVLIDTHLDTAQDVGGEKLNHCAPITRAVEAGYDPKKITLIGMSGWMNPRGELDYARDQGMTIIWLEDIWEHGTQWAIDKALQVSGSDDGIYLTVDVDALDSAFAPGTCAPTPGGLTMREMIELVRGISAHGLIGVDVAEVAPSLDPTGRTQLMGNRILLEALAFHAGCKR
jgi:agmatinase